MRPSAAHAAILALLMFPGLVLLLAESLSPHSGGIFFNRYDAIKLYGLALAAYAFCSTFITAAVYLIYKAKRLGFSPRKVILCHLLPIGFVLLFVQLGAHDFIQRAWQGRGKDLPSTTDRVSERAERGKPPIPPTPSAKPALHSASRQIIKVTEQTATDEMLKDPSR